MTVIDTYLSTLDESTRRTIAHMYSVVRRIAPDVTEELSYAMPALKYKGKGLVAIMANTHFFSLYPFQSVDKLGLDLSMYACTTGSIHFTSDKPISDDLLRDIISARMNQIEENI